MDVSVASALAADGITSTLQLFGHHLALGCNSAAFTRTLTEAGLAIELADVVEAAMRARAWALFHDPPCAPGPVGGACIRGV